MNTLFRQFITISREEIEQLMTNRAKEIFDSFNPFFLEMHRNKVLIRVIGYDSDKRELFDIPEVRRYFQKLFSEVPEFLYWIDLESYMFLFVGLMLYTPIREGKNVTLSSQDMQAYLIHGFTGLNEFCQSNGLSPKPTNDLVMKITR